MTTDRSVASAIGSTLVALGVDQDALATAVGATPMRVTAAETAIDVAMSAYRAAAERRTVLLDLPLVTSKLIGKDATVAQVDTSARSLTE